MSVSKKISITDDNAKFLIRTNMSGSVIQWSAGINAAITELKFILKCSMPMLDDSEWQRILDFYKNNSLPIHKNIDSVGIDLISDIEKVNDSFLLVEKIKNMNHIEKLAILYFVQIFLSSEWNNCNNLGKIKTEIMNLL